MIYWIRPYTKAATYPKPNSGIGDNSHKPHLWDTMYNLQTLERSVSPPGREFSSPQQVFIFSYLERSLADLLSFSIRVFTSIIFGASFLSLGGNVSGQSNWYSSNFSPPTMILL